MGLLVTYTPHQTAFGLSPANAHFSRLGGKCTSLCSYQGTGAPQGTQTPGTMSLLLPGVRHLAPAGWQPPTYGAGGKRGIPRRKPLTSGRFSCILGNMVFKEGKKGSWCHCYSLRCVPSCQDAAKDNGVFKMSIKNSWYYETQKN